MLLSFSLLLLLLFTFSTRALATLPTKGHVRNPIPRNRSSASELHFTCAAVDGAHLFHFKPLDDFVI